MSFIGNETVFSICVSILSILISILGVWYGREGFKVTKKIFKEGIKKDREKVLSQLSLEFVTGFIVPFSKFKIANDIIWEQSYKEQNLQTVCNWLKASTFSATFSYWDLHKGDIWDAFADYKEEEQAQAFNSIMEFVKIAGDFEKRVNNLQGMLNDYLKDSNSSGTFMTLEKFFLTHSDVYMDMFSKGKQMIKEVDECIEKLPKELKILEMKRKLCRD